MEEDGLLTLRAEEGNRKNKKIYLTEKGEKLVEQIVDPLMDAEVRATESLGEQEMEKFLKIMKRQTELFREEIANFTSPLCDTVAQK
jgi:DNA-binding MarR family transcriptional regulator